MFSLFIFQIVEEDFSQVCLARLLQRLHQEVFIINHEPLQLLLVKPFMLKFALIDFAHACTV